MTIGPLALIVELEFFADLHQRWERIYGGTTLKIVVGAILANDGEVFADNGRSEMAREVIDLSGFGQGDERSDIAMSHNAVQQVDPLRCCLRLRGGIPMN